MNYITLTTVLRNMARQFVLVPGAWLGGWCWKYLTPLLRDEGHDVYTPTLTGVGEREHLRQSEISLETHITDIVNLLEYNEFTDVVLLGHSYAGLVVTGVAERVPERLAHIIYLDALVPMNDEPVSASAFYPPDEWIRWKQRQKTMLAVGRSQITIRDGWVSRTKTQVDARKGCPASTEYVQTVSER